MNPNSDILKSLSVLSYHWVIPNVHSSIFPNTESVSGQQELVKIYSN